MGGDIELNEKEKLRPTSTPALHLEFANRRDMERLGRQRLYVRERSASVYRNSKWLVPDEQEFVVDAGDGNSDGQLELKPLRGDEVEHTLYFSTRSNRSLFALPGLRAINMRGIWRQGEDWFLLPSSRPDRMKVTCWSTPVHYDEIREEFLRPGDTDVRFRQYPDTPLMRNIQVLSDSLPYLSRNSMTSIIDEQLRYFRHNFTYSLDVENVRGLDPLENFLFHEKRAFCSYFATAFTLMLRMQGIPARVSSGYCGGTFVEDSNVVTFHTGEAHAWTEIFTEKYGWVIVDPTPPSPFSPTEPRQVVGTPPQLENFQSMRNGPDQEPTMADSFLRWMRNVLIPSNVILALLLLLFPLVYLLLRQVLRRAEERREAGGLNFFHQFCQHFARLGRPRRIGSTPKEYLHQIKQDHLADNEFDDLVNYYYAVAYCDSPRDKIVEKQFEQRLKEHSVEKRGRA